MLNSWPVENLFWWSCLPECTDRFGQRTAAHHCAAIPDRFYPNRKLVRLKSVFLESVWAKRAAVRLAETLRMLNPDVVWAIPHNWSIPPLARAGIVGSKCYHVTMQDYVDIHTNPLRFGVERCRRMATMADELYASATTRDATSHPMIADLRDRTGKEGSQMLHAGLEPLDFECLERKSPRKSPVIRIAHAGTILVEEVFSFFVSVLDDIRRDLARPVELHLFGAHTYSSRPWFQRNWMVEHGDLPGPELLANLRQCDWGFAPMALTDEDPRYSRYSFPTKFITYLAAGLSIVTLGHPESAVIKMATQYDVGLCTSTDAAEPLARLLKTGLNAPCPWERHGDEILRCARTEFDAARMRNTLYACFSKCSGSGVTR